MFDISGTGTGKPMYAEDLYGAGQNIVADQMAPGIKRMTGYESPKRKAMAIAESADLGSMASIQRSHKQIQAINPTAASAWLKDALSTFKANIEQQELAASAGGTPLKAKEAHLQSVRNRFIKAKGPEEGERAFGAYLQAQGTQMQGTIPQGYRMSPNGTLEIIPGGPKEIETKAAEEAMKNRQALAKRAIGVVQGSLDDALRFYEKAEGKDSDVSDAVFGVAGRAASATLRPNRMNMETVVETIRANIGFDRLQQMREASPTGGALGQVAVQELVALQATLGNLSLDQSPEQFFKTVKEIQKHYNNMLQVIDGKMPEGSNPLGI